MCSMKVQQPRWEQRSTLLALQRRGADALRLRASHSCELPSNGVAAEHSSKPRNGRSHAAPQRKRAADAHIMLQRLLLPALHRGLACLFPGVRLVAGDHAPAALAAAAQHQHQLHHQQSIAGDHAAVTTHRDQGESSSWPPPSRHHPGERTAWPSLARSASGLMPAAPWASSSSPGRAVRADQGTCSTSGASEERQAVAAEAAVQQRHRLRAPQRDHWGQPEHHLASARWQHTGAAACRAAHGLPAWPSSVTFAPPHLLASAAPGAHAGQQRHRDEWPAVQVGDVRGGGGCPLLCTCSVSS